MADATTVAAGTIVASATAGTVLMTSLPLIGVDVQSLGAAMLGCVIVQTLLPAERINVGAIIATTVGSMIFASFAAPFVAPLLAKLSPSGVADEHLRASAAALVAAFPKPLLVMIKRRWEKATGVGDAV